MHRICAAHKEVSSLRYWSKTKTRTHNDFRFEGLADYTLELHVDHLMPFSAGGKTVPENLRSTCSDCNLGKGSKTE
jgi:5-methylcytosine-specific restriction endonuclease McrA